MSREKIYETENKCDNNDDTYNTDTRRNIGQGIQQR